MGIGQFFKGLFQGDFKVDVADNPILDQAAKEAGTDGYWYNLKAVDFPVFAKSVLPLSDKEKADFIVRHVILADQFRRESGRMYNDLLNKQAHICRVFIEQLLRTNIQLDEHDFARIAAAFIKYNEVYFRSVMGWPVKSLVTLAQKKYKNGNVPDIAVKAFTDIKMELKTSQNPYYEKQIVKIIDQIDTLLFVGESTAAIKPVYFLGDDEFAMYANAMIKQLAEVEKPHWYQLISLCQKSSGSKPSKKFLTDGQAIIEAIGTDRFVEVVSNWFVFITKMKEKRVEHAYIIAYDFLASVNVECLKGFVWLCTGINKTELLDQIAALADKAYRKLAGVGQTCTALGNAAVFTLYKSEGLDGVNHLSRLKLKVKQSSTQAIIERYLEAKAQEQGISSDAIEDIAVEDFELENTQKQVQFDDYKAVLSIEKVGKVNLNWYKKDGTLQKSDPSSVKEKFPQELKKLKAEVKQIEAALSTQKERLDRGFKAERRMDWAHFNNYYHDHSLVSFLSRQLIWRFENDNECFDAFYDDGKWTDPEGKVFEPGESHRVSLWHPATGTVLSVKQWRDYLVARQIQQPLKQAFREIYLLTDAEINTRTYSNRMAGHILKQHQFNSLAKARDWRYSLQGAFDGGSEGAASINLPQQQLVAEYWVNGVDDINDNGIMNYVATDQVRFKSTQTGRVLELAEIPVVVLSEVLRDVDLFVGVASVGNDPTWRDSGGLAGYRDYWHTYAFGELSEMAKGRKEILEKLVPVLKIGKVSELTDKFLIVKGKLRTYKIHLGSTNILMEPNDQYLCIVPDRSAKSPAEKVFLPFEGDAGLSIIISKAILLADDDKITDETITRQINWA